MKSTGSWRAIAVLAIILVAIGLTAVVLTSSDRPAASSSPSPALAAASAASSSPSGSAAIASPASASAPSSHPATSTTVGLPNSRLTPGAVNPAVTPSNLASTICAKGWTATIRPPASYTTALKRRQISEYGYTDTALADYEEDHLISLELGGAPRDPANLWPEPYTATLPDGTRVGARVKDQVENALNDLVCSGSMPLATAQHLIATDWISAWRQYVAP